MTAKVEFKDDRLTLLAPGQPEYELIPLGNHHFNVAGLPGYRIEFETAGAKDAATAGPAVITAFTFIKADGTSFKVTKKK